MRNTEPLHNPNAPQSNWRGRELLYETAVQNIMAEYFSDEYSECFFLVEIATDPVWQRQGAASILVDCMKEHATREKVCMGTIQTKSMEAFLSPHGFDRIDNFKVNDGISGLGGLIRHVYTTEIFGSVPNIPAVDDHFDNERFTLPWGALGAR